MCPSGDTATITTVLSINRVDPRRFSSRCYAFWCTHTRSADRIRVLRTLDLLLALTIRAQRKTYGWCSALGPMVAGLFCMTVYSGIRGEKDPLDRRWAHWGVQQP